MKTHDHKPPRGLSARQEGWPEKMLRSIKRKAAKRNAMDRQFAALRAKMEELGVTPERMHQFLAEKVTAERQAQEMRLEKALTRALCGCTAKDCPKHGSYVPEEAAFALIYQK